MDKIYVVSHSKYKYVHNDDAPSRRWFTHIDDETTGYLGYFESLEDAIYAINSKKGDLAKDKFVVCDRVEGFYWNEYESKFDVKDNVDALEGYEYVFYVVSYPVGKRLL